MASTEFLALEQGLEKESEESAKSLEQVQRQLEETEAQTAPEDLKVTDARPRKKDLIAERERAAEAVDEALQKLAQAETASRRHASELESRIETMRAETEERIRAAVAEAAEQISERVRARLAEEANQDAARTAERLKHRERELRAEVEREVEEEIRRELEQELAKRIDQIKRSAESRAKLVDAARSDSKAAQRKLDDIAKSIQGAPAVVEPEQRSDRDRSAQLEELEAELARLGEEFDEMLVRALTGVEAETEARMRDESERRMREREEAIRAEAEERLRAETDAIRTQMAREAEEEIATLRARLEQEAEAKRMDAVVAAKAAAAEWLRGQTERLLRNAEKRAKSAEPKQTTPAPEPVTEEQSAVEPEHPAAALVEPESKAPPVAAPARVSPLDINKASFEQLREVGLSVTQATRVIAYRERQGFNSVDELGSVPGFPKRFLADVRDRLTA
jgi:DNA uptake protein ComE-like DNA-binding protein